MKNRKEETGNDLPRRSAAATALVALAASVGIAGSAEADVVRVQQQIEALRAGNFGQAQSRLLQQVYEQSSNLMISSDYCQYVQSGPAEPENQYTQSYTQSYTQTC